jgi:hypothetical protein
MKTLLLIAAVCMIALTSCKESCYDCTRTWIHYDTDGDPNPGRVDNFNVCGDEQRDNAEKIQVTTYPQAGPNAKDVGTCVCVED